MERTKLLEGYKPEMGEWRMVWDEAHSVAESRPTTPEDIWNDIHIEESSSLDDLYDLLVEMFRVREREYPRETKENLLKSIDELINLGCYDDGSPNIIYLSIDGKTLIDEAGGAYPEAEGCDLATINETDLKSYMAERCEDDDSDYDDELAGYSALARACDKYDEDELWESVYEIGEDSDGYYDDEVSDNDLYEAKDDDEETVNESTNPLISKLRKKLQEDTSTIEEETLYDKASELANKINKPVVYGYTKKGKFYGLTPKEYHGDDKAFRSQYSANTIQVAYPDKPFAGRSVKEDLTDKKKVKAAQKKGLGESLYEDTSFADGIDQDLLDTILDDTDGTIEDCEDNNCDYGEKQKSEDEEFLDEAFENKKQRCIDMYNNCKDWANDPAAYVSCKCNVDYNKLTEWLKGDKN